MEDVGKKDEKPQEKKEERREEEREEKKETGRPEEGKMGKLRKAVTKVKRFWESIDEVILVLFSIPLIGDLIKNYAAKKKKEIFKPASTDGRPEVKESGEGLGDEIRFDDVTHLLDDPNQKKLEQLLAEMELLEQGKEKIKALRIFVALKASVTQEINEIDKSERGKTKKIRKKNVDLEPGKKFLEALLAKETLTQRLQFMKNRGVFDNIPPQKESGAAGSFFDIGIEFSERVVHVAGDFLERNAPKIEKKIGEYAKKTGKGVKKSAKAVNKEVVELSEWIETNINKKVEYRGFWREAFWFIPEKKKKIRRMR